MTHCPRPPRGHIRFHFRLRPAVAAALLAVITIVLAGSQAAPAWAQTWPTRPVRIIAPYAPGGVTDLLAREIGTALTQRIGTTFIVENRPGGGGNIGLSMLAHAAADGYTLGEGAANTLVANHFLYRTRAFETLRDFVPIAFVGRLPFVLVAHPSVAAANLRALIAEMKSRRLGYSYGSSGVGNTAHVFGELLARRAGIDLLHVPYKSSGEALRDLIAGRTQLQFITPVELAGPIQQGAVRAIAVAAPTRIASFPEVATLDEQGYRGFESPTWFGFIGPAGLAPEIVQRLNHEIREILATPATRARLARAGLEFQDMTVEQFRAFIVAEMTQWEGIVRDAGIQLD